MRRSFVRFIELQSKKTKKKKNGDCNLYVF